MRNRVSLFASVVLFQPTSAAIVMCALAGSATAQTYGTSDGGCEQAAGNPINDTAVYFDGTKLGGLGWTCELTPAAGDAYVGLCTDEGSTNPATQVTFTIIAEGDTVSIASDADDQVFTLKRCP